jgi:hypothetical protein
MEKVLFLFWLKKASKKETLGKKRCRSAVHIHITLKCILKVKWSG